MSFSEKTQYPSLPDYNQGHKIELEMRQNLRLAAMGAVILSSLGVLLSGDNSLLAGLMVSATFLSVIGTYCTNRSVKNYQEHIASYSSNKENVGHLNNQPNNYTSKIDS